MHNSDAAGLGAPDGGAGSVCLGAAKQQKGRTEELLRLILALSTNFIVLPAEEVDDGIHDVLGAVGNFASVDRCYVFQFCDDNRIVRITHEWRSRGNDVKAGKPRNFSENELPWLLGQIRGLGVVNISDTGTLPSKARAENIGLLGEDVLSLLAVPMVYGDSLAGFVGLDSLTGKRTWDEEIVSLLKIVGEIFVNALARKRAAETVRISEEKYRNIFENATEGIFQSTPEGRFLSVNPSMARMYHYESPEEMIRDVAHIGTQLYVDPGRHEELRALLDTRGHVEGFEVKRRRKDGTTFWSSVNARAVRDEQGKAIYYEGTYEDITARKDMEDLLLRERETFRQMLHKAPYGVVLMDSEGTYLYVNPEYTHITGYTLHDILADREWLKRCYPEAAYRTDVVAFARENSARKYRDKVFRSISRDGSAKEIEFRKVDLEDGRTVITLSDITEKLRAAETVRESEVKFRTLFEDSKDAIYIAARDGRLIECNQSFLDLFGFDRDEIPFIRAGRVIFSREERESLKRVILEKGSLKDYEVKLLNKNGTVMDCLITVSERKTGDGSIIGYQGIVRDVTRVKKTEEAIRHMAYHDALTGLPNRVLFGDRLSIAMARARRAGESVAVAVLDLDGFKRINDKLGHKVGDFILKAVANRLLSVLRKSDTVARMGGDEFYLILSEMNSPADAEMIAEKIVAAFRKWFSVDTHRLFVTASLGIALYPSDGEDADLLVKRADVAMYAAKKTGKNGYCRYDRKLEEV